MSQADFAAYPPAQRMAIRRPRLRNGAPSAIVAEAQDAMQATKFSSPTLEPDGPLADPGGYIAA